MGQTQNVEIFRYQMKGTIEEVDISYSVLTYIMANLLRALFVSHKGSETLQSQPLTAMLVMSFVKA